MTRSKEESLTSSTLQPKQSLEEVCSQVLENIGNKDVHVEQLNAFGKVYAILQVELLISLLWSSQLEKTRSSLLRKTMLDSKK